MTVNVRSGKYVVAVSGGIDSMVLLDLVRQEKDVDIVVAHFDHGMRPDSIEDRLFVELYARRHKLEFVYGEGRLGPSASEAIARQARYAFLNKLKNDHAADAIMTAHHQDDILETIMINLLRGTGRKGLSSLRSTAEVVRPLLDWAKQDIKSYAKSNAIEWREDPTNGDQLFLRNYVRHSLLPKLNPQRKRELLDLSVAADKTNQEIDSVLQKMFRPSEQPVLKRSDIARLSHQMARELMAAWLRSSGVRDFDRHAIERLTVFAKVAKPHSTADVNKKRRVVASRTTLALQDVER